MQRRPKLWFFILLWVFVLTSFMFSAATVLTIALGYRVNWQTKTLQKTGILVLETEPRRVEVWLDNVKVADKTPYRGSYLLPKAYEVRLSAPGYHGWQKTIHIEENRVSSQTGIVLVLDPIEQQSVDADVFNALPILQNEPKLEIRQASEVWYDNKLVTRFFHPVLETRLLYGQHILMHSDNRLTLMERDGTNPIVLSVKLPSTNLEYRISIDRRTLYVNTGQEILAYKIFAS